MFHRYINYKCAMINSYVKLPEGKYNCFLSFLLAKQIHRGAYYTGRDQTDGPLIWSASILGRPATTGIYCDLSIVYFHSIWKPQESWPRIEVEQMNHVFSFCTGLASPVVSHIWLSVADSDGAQAPKPPRIGVSEALDGGRCDCVYQPYHRPARIHFRRLATKHGVGRARNRWVCYGLLWLEPCWHLFSWMTLKSRTWQSDLLICFVRRRPRSSKITVRDSPSLTKTWYHLILNHLDPPWWNTG